MEDYIKLANKLNLNHSITKSNFLEENSLDDCCMFFNFIKNSEHCEKINDIYSELLVFEDIRCLYPTFKNSFGFEENTLLMSIFIFKSIMKISIIENTNDIRFVNSDQVLNNILGYYNRFLVFYFKIEIENRSFFKKILFKFISILVTNDVVMENLIRSGNKTLKQWSFLFESISLNSAEYLNLNKKPFSIVLINNSYYLRGSFFTNVHKIFEENLRSNQKFQFKTEEYLNRLVKTKYYLNNADLADVISIIEKKKGLSYSSLLTQISGLNEEIRNNLEKIIVSNKRFKNFYEEPFKEWVRVEYEKFRDGENKAVEFVLNFFISFCENIFIKEGVDISNFNKIELRRILENFLNLELKQKNCNKKTEYCLLEIISLFNRQDIENVIKVKSDWFRTLKKENLKSKQVDNINLIKNMESVYFLAIKFAVSEDWIMHYRIKNEFNLNLINDNKKICAKISELMIYNNLYLLKNLGWTDNTPLYFAFFFDFRGRFYYKSAVSPTNLKYSRYIFTYGYYSDSDLSGGVPTRLSSHILIYYKYIQLVKKKYGITRSGLKINESIFWVLISIGKIKIEKELIEISVVDILEKAIVLLDHSSELNLIDSIELMHYKKILTSLTLKLVPARGVLKDATASFLQNLIRLMGYKNENSLKYANLNSVTHWYDTYSFILNKWKEKERIKYSEELSFFELYSRKTVKKPIMTAPYSATYMTAFSYFKDSLREQKNLDIDFGSKEEESFKRFHKFISNEVENVYFLRNSSKKIVEHIKKTLKENKKELIISSHDSKTNLIYYKLISKNYDLIITVGNKQKKRITKKYEEIDEFQIDYKKIARSIRANWVHYIDALLLRDINKASNKTYLTIHDCFIVDFLSVSDFILVANEQSNKKIFEVYEWNLENKKEFFSLFIFI